MSRALVVEQLGIAPGFARRLEAEGLLEPWPVADIEQYRARLLLISRARKAGVTLSVVRRALLPQEVVTQ